jgi:hypothetical protein
MHHTLGIEVGEIHQPLIPIVFEDARNGARIVENFKGAYYTHRFKLLFGSAVMDEACRSPVAEAHRFELIRLVCHSSISIIFLFYR